MSWWGISLPYVSRCLQCSEFISPSSWKCMRIFIHVSAVLTGVKKRPKPQRSDADQVGLSITKQTLANSDKGLYFLPSISLRHVKFEYFLRSFAKQSRERLLVSPCLSTHLFLHIESFGSHLKYCLKI